MCSSSSNGSCEMGREGLHKVQKIFQSFKKRIQTVFLVQNITTDYQAQLWRIKVGKAQEMKEKTSFQKYRITHF
jgi:hypothetical protein